MALSLSPPSVNEQQGKEKGRASGPPEASPGARLGASTAQTKQSNQAGACERSHWCLLRFKSTSTTLKRRKGLTKWLYLLDKVAQQGLPGSAPDCSRGSSRQDEGGGRAFNQPEAESEAQGRAWSK